MSGSIYKLTEEGRRYLENGLPEANLVNSLKEPMDIEDVKARIENFGIALQWAKKKNWVKLESGKLFLVRKPSQVPEHEALRKISTGRRVDGKMIDLLLKRKLIYIEREDVVKRAQKMIGKEIDNLAPELIKTGMWRKAKIKPYNVKVTGKKIYPGKRQPYKHFLTEVRQRLVELGFREMEGPMIETEFWNFDALYQAQDHPSRDWAQTYTLKHPKYGRLPSRGIVSRVKAAHENGWKTGSTGWGYKWDIKKASQLMPRAHTTASSARTLAKLPEIPGKYFAISRCFRPDVIDATHGVEFNQMEGIVIDKSLTFKEMLGVLKMFAIEIGGAKEFRFYADYYPFTEPSVQLSIKHPQMGWIELAGAGIFRPELTEPLGVKEPVIAWGLGIDRLAMFKLNIDDIRELFSKNLDWLRNQRVLI
ncbi:MAG: phenylalanine--tRNA ligase subunit alpha [Candidatus Aenigmatarchaeota archaeon]|nr:MAG: phenylalanine--tRNA ligase subunit alpha [Candidatus Aenigmarchaeota archaeon]